MTMLVTGEQCEQDRKSEWCQLADLMARGGGTETVLARLLSSHIIEWRDYDERETSVESV